MGDRLIITPFYVELLESLKAKITQCGIKSVMGKRGKIIFTEAKPAKGEGAQNVTPMRRARLRKSWCHYFPLH